MTFLGNDMTEVRARARLAADWLSTGVWSDGYDIHGEKRSAE